MTKLREAVEALLQELHADCWTDPEHSDPCDLPVCLAAEKVNATLAADDEGDLIAAERGSAAEAATILLAALGWDSGGLVAAADEIVKQRDDARAIIAAWRGGR